jgi:hypothetical protein
MLLIRVPIGRDGPVIDLGIWLARALAHALGSTSRRRNRRRERERKVSLGSIEEQQETIEHVPPQEHLDAQPAKVVRGHHP